MLLEMEHWEVDYVDFFGALQQELVTGGRDIVTLAANLKKSVSVFGRDSLRLYQNFLVEDFLELGDKTSNEIAICWPR